MKPCAINDNLLLPQYIETNIQYTNKFFKIPTADTIENRPVRRKIIETAYKPFFHNYMEETI